MIKVALVDDHVVLRNALAVLVRMGGFEVVAEADNGAELLKQLPSCVHPDIILLDVTMPGIDGVETAILLQRQYPKLKIVVLTVLKNESVRLRMFKSGARAYLFKDCETEELIVALHEVHTHGYYNNEQMPVEIPHAKSDFYKTSLNRQQRSFLRWAATDLTHREIAEKMQVSQRTVDSYRDVLFKKLNINSRVGLVKYAIRNGFVHW